MVYRSWTGYRTVLGMELERDGVSRRGLKERRVSTTVDI